MIFLFSALCLCTLNIIPEPNDIKVNDGFFFTLKSTTSIYFDKSVPDLIDVVNVATRTIRVSTGYAFQYKDTASINQINFVKSDVQLGLEEYKLTVTEDTVTITASANNGFVYGFQTLLQIFPPEIYSKGTIRNVKWTIPCVEVNDKPRFEWRGSMLDVSRHFFTIDTLKKVIDSFPLQKLNYLHLHLTDDQGWRIEIKKYPKFTQEAATSSGRPIPWYNDIQDNVQYGPFFYTQEEIKDLIKYAKARGVTLVPEIDIPGHTLSGVVAYPELSCTGGPFDTLPNFTSTPEVFCLGNDKTIDTLKDVLDEIMDLFSNSPYIHIGGDETNTERWKTCPKCQQRIIDEKLSGVDKLQHWFTKQISDHVKSRNRILLGWDDILTDGLDKSTHIMGWHYNAGIKAAENGYKTVQTPSTLLYTCQYQFTVPDEFQYAIFGLKTLAVQYNYEATDGISESKKANVIGMQTSLWTEWVWGDEKDIFWKFYPRNSAIGENGWTNKNKKDFNRFLTALIRSHNKRMDCMKIVHAPAGQTKNTFWGPTDLKGSKSSISSLNSVNSWTTKKWSIIGGLGKEGPYEAAFILTGGKNPLLIKNVKITIDDKVIAQSTEEGKAAWEATGNNIFKLNTSEDGTNKDAYIEADIMGEDGTNSIGEIVLYYTTNK